MRTKKETSKAKRHTHTKHVETLSLDQLALATGGEQHKLQSIFGCRHGAGYLQEHPGSRPYLGRSGKAYVMDSLGHKLPLYNGDHGPSVDVGEVGGTAREKFKFSQVRWK